jgi:oligopeptide transport system ATP-binding protein
MTIIFQDPLAALDPQMTVGAVVREPLDIFEPGLPYAEKQRRVAEVLTRVGLGGVDLRRHPHQFSGGQCQRIGIARALILKPRMILCDEAVSALDVSVQAQIMILLARLRREENLALLFIAHNLAVVRQLSDRVMVLYLGRVMELAGRDQLYRAPAHPYTRALLAAVPIPDPAIERGRPHIGLAGELPSAIDPISGCVFHTRCPHAIARCRDEIPLLETIAPDHQVACHRSRELADG